MSPQPQAAVNVFPVTDEVVERCIKPFQDWILVRLDKPLQRYTRRILAPGMAKPPPRTGRVVAVGPGQIITSLFQVQSDADYAKMDVKAGDYVMIDVRETGRVIAGNPNYMLFRQDNVCAICTEDIWGASGMRDELDES